MPLYAPVESPGSFPLSSLGPAPSESQVSENSFCESLEGSPVFTKFRVSQISQQYLTAISSKNLDGIKDRLRFGAELPFVECRVQGAFQANRNIVRVFGEFSAVLLVM